MKTKILIIGALAAAALAAAGWGLYAIGMQRGMEHGPVPAIGQGPSASPASGAAPATEAAPLGVAQGEEATRRHIKSGIKAGDIDPVIGKKVLYYHDPMAPGKRFDKPAKSPFMDMMLVPVYAEGGASTDAHMDAGRVTVSPRVQQSLGVRTALATEGTVSPQLTAVGNIAWNERDQVIVQARATAFVERLQVRATYDRVAKGQTLAELFVPEWIAAQEEFLSIRRMQGTDLAALIDGARQRLRLVGMSEEQIALVESSGRTQARFAILAPIGGVVTELLAREGMTVTAGTTLLRISGTGTVWANAEVPESQVPLLRPGTKVMATSPAAPGITFQGRVQALLPEVNAGTRTVKVRLELANPDGRLVPGLFVQMQFMDLHAAKALLIPTEAVIQTGQRTVVLLAEQDGSRFRPVEIEAGLESGGQTEVKRGLSAGQRVVVSSQFLIDSEASLKGLEARLNAASGGLGGAASAPAPAASKAAVRHAARGRIESIDAREVTLEHGPIPSVGMGAMTMPYRLTPASAAPRGLRVGDEVDFEFVLDETEGPTITRLALRARAASTPARDATSTPAAGPSPGASR
jgi:Cu(I)/Ag(I) efflux system membrane fusion protein